VKWRAPFTAGFLFAAVRIASTVARHQCIGHDRRHAASSSMMQSDQAVSEVYCPQCGYDLRGIDSTRCPECGFEIDRLTLANSQIPWTHRARMGRYRAFVRTAWLATRNPTTLARDVARPVSYGGAQRFRWIVVLVAAAPLVAAALVLRALLANLDVMPMLSRHFSTWPPAPLPPHFDFTLCLIVGVTMWPVPSIAILLCLAAISGVSSYFFHPKSLPVVMQSRAVALSAYACAPLVAMIVPCVLGGLALALSWDGVPTRRGQFQVFAFLVLLASLSVPAILFFCTSSTLRILRATTRCATSHAWLVAVLLPVLWLGLAIVTLLGIPIVCGFIYLMIQSYRT
jgi:hypothetical protein